MLINFEQLSSLERYHIMTQTVIPRPIAWVLSENTANKTKTEEASYNLAPFSYFNAICSEPPLLMISVAKQLNNDQKDTSTNLAMGEHCVVHIPSSVHAKEVTQSAATMDYGVSEVDALNLALQQESGFSLPRLVICKIAFMCEVYDRKIIGQSEQNLIFLKINKTFVSDELTSQDAKGRLLINAAKADPLARLGANQYSSISGVLDLKRPK